MVQERLGVRDQMEGIGRRMLRDFMPDQHRAFFEELPFLLIGTLDAASRPWASLLVGTPGFVRSLDPRSLTVAARPPFGDPATAAFAEGSVIGILGIQPETRRRNRANGRIAARDEQSFSVHIEQSFGNCPKYIQARRPTFARPPSSASDPHVVEPQTATLTPDAVSLVRRSDTFFVASAASATPAGGLAEGVDVSHRGGRPGFVQVHEEGGQTVLTWPDFEGNYLFNTLGNLVRHPRAGLLFPDFETGDLLTLTCDTEIVWDGPEVEAFEGAQRLVRARVVSGALLRDALPLRWTPVTPARENARTGTWPLA
jgi:predicted pyridoxine 5'-phosphate oxidase superfamily flavin-nucleotide-binding protein